ncbi:MAG TPA: hypothetical protein VIL65_06350 [Beijerinckiaceae bacterium]|jgi:hypothetical protein
MSTNNLAAFCAKLALKGRISFGDVQRLRRDVLPDGLASRDEAEALFALDRQVASADAAWAAFLAEAVTDLLVWTERPTGLVSEEAAAWLKSVLLASGGPSRAARLVAREIAEEANVFENEALTTLAACGIARSTGRRAPAAEAAAAVLAA